MDASPTPPAAETKRRKYKKMGGTSFWQRKGSKKSKDTNKATRVTKQSANTAILASLNKTFENEEDAFKNNGSENEDDAIKNESVMLCKEDVRKLIHLFYVKIGCPPPEDWYGNGRTIATTIKALAMSADKCRKMIRVITDTCHCLHHGEVYNEGRALQKNVTAIADGSKIQQLIADYREARLSYSQTTLMINMHCNKNNLRTVTQSAIISCTKRMKRMVVPVTKCLVGTSLLWLGDTIANTVRKRHLP
jgi:hypothetical protein